MSKSTSATPVLTIGLDVGDRHTHYCVLDAARKVTKRGRFCTTPSSLEGAMKSYQGTRVVLEAGTHSPWMSRRLKDLGLQVHVADPRRVQLISKDPRKTDRRDAETLARLEAGAPELLGDVFHRSEQAQADLCIVRARDQLVQTRASLITQVRCLVKTTGNRLPSNGTSPKFARNVRDLIPDILRPAIDPLLDILDYLTKQIRSFEKSLEDLAKTRYPETEQLRQVHGVGGLTSMTYMLTMEDPMRFTDSRSVGSWLGLCPRVHASGDSNPHLRISKAGDHSLRRLLVQCAHYILGPFGQDSDLRRFGLRLRQQGGSRRKRAVVAVARKLAVLLHRLWRNGLVYDPLHAAKRSENVSAA